MTFNNLIQMIVKIREIRSATWQFSSVIIQLVYRGISIDPQDNCFSQFLCINCPLHNGLRIILNIFIETNICNDDSNIVWGTRQAPQI